MSGISLYLDEDVRVLLAEVLRSRGYKARHTLEVNRGGKSDEEQLAYAVKNGMCILTHNIKDFILLSKTYEKHAKEHFGIVVSAQLPFGELLKRTLKFLSVNSKDSVKNTLIWMEEYK